MNNSYNKSTRNTSTFGKRLRERRIHLKLSQESLGVSIGLDESCCRTRISRYESDLHEPKIATAQLIANKLNVPLAYLYCERDSISELLLKVNLMTEDQVKLISKLAQSILDR